MRKSVGIVLALGFVIVAAAIATAQGGSGSHPAGVRVSAPAGEFGGTPRADRAKARSEPREARAEGRGFRLLHADGVAMRRDGTTVAVRMQKGIIQQVDGDSITLKSPDGYTQTYAINGETRVREKGQASSASALKAGDAARVLAVKDGEAYTAKLINYGGAPGRRQQETAGAA